MGERMLDKSEAPSIDAMTVYCGAAAAMFSESNERLSVKCGSVRESQ